MSLLLSPLAQLSNPLEHGCERRWIESGYQGTADTIAAMQQLTEEGKRSPKLRELVGSLIQGCPKKDYYCYASKFFDYCQNKIQYAFDPVGVEWTESVERILKAGIADCDSICILFCSMCENVGLSCRFVTIKADMLRSDEFSHVYAEVFIPKKGWVAADCTMQHPFGWAAEGFERKDWPATSTSRANVGVEGLNGLSDFGGMSDFAAEEQITASPVEIEEASYCRGCESLVATGPETDFFNPTLPKQNFLTGLGAAPDEPRLTAIIMDIWEGRYANELESMKRTQQNRQGELETLAQKVVGNPLEEARIRQARISNTEALQATHAAINKYNEVLNTLQTYSFGAINVSRLSGLGALPAIAAAQAVSYAIIAAGAAVGFYALADVIRAARGVENKTKGIIEQGGYVIESAAGLTANLTWAALVFGGGFLLLQYLKKTGKLR